MELAVLLTCHNRREHTLRCLRALFAQQEVADITLQIWLVDDGSSDGTAEAVAESFPSVRQIRGTGDLYWCGGMSLAWNHAVQAVPDAFLWLNDDVVLHSHAIASVHAVAQTYPEAVVVGSCESPETGSRTYGGLQRTGSHPGKLHPIVPTDVPLMCDTFEGNVVWIPWSAFEVTGPMGDYQHAMGDIDYGYRLARRGIQLLVAPGFVGLCSANSRKNTWEDASLPIPVRLQKLHSVKGLPSRDWWQFCRRFGGLRAPWYYVSPFFRVLARR